MLARPESESLSRAAVAGCRLLAWWGGAAFWLQLAAVSNANLPLSLIVETLELSLESGIDGMSLLRVCEVLIERLLLGDTWGGDRVPLE